jgi:hypothetical protein
MDVSKPIIILERKKNVATWGTPKKIFKKEKRHYQLFVTFLNTFVEE